MDGSGAGFFNALRELCHLFVRSGIEVSARALMPDVVIYALRPRLFLLSCEWWGRQCRKQIVPPAFSGINTEGFSSFNRIPGRGYLWFSAKEHDGSHYSRQDETAASCSAYPRTAVDFENLKSLKKAITLNVSAAPAKVASTSNSVHI